jgi:hypothetical protein
MTRYPGTVRWQISLPLVPLVFLFGCSSGQEVAKAPSTKGEPELFSKPIATNGKTHPLAKNIELGGFRISEPKPGTLRIKFNVVNHSLADLGDLEMNVSLAQAGSKPEDPPICVLKVKVPSLGPEESKAVEASTTTKLRVYELPDWQFIRAFYEITSPPA